MRLILTHSSSRVEENSIYSKGERERYFFHQKLIGEKAVCPGEVFLLQEMKEDVVYHLALGSGSHDLSRMFGDVRFVCMGGTPQRMKSFAEYMLKELGYILPTGTCLLDISERSHRYSKRRLTPPQELKQLFLSDFHEKLTSFSIGLQMFKSVRIFEISLLLTVIKYSCF